MIGSEDSDPFSIPQMSHSRKLKIALSTSFLTSNAVVAFLAITAHYTSNSTDWREGDFAPAMGARFSTASSGLPTIRRIGLAFP